MRGKRTDREKLDRALALYAQGVKLTAIETETGVGTDTVVRYAKRAGMPGRPMGRPRKVQP